MFHPRYLGRVPYLSTRVCASRLIISLGIANIYITDFSNTAYLNPGMFVGKHMPSLVARIFEAFCDYTQDIIYQRSPFPQVQQKFDWRLPRHSHNHSPVTSLIRSFPDCLPLTAPPLTHSNNASPRSKASSTRSFATRACHGVPSKWSSATLKPRKMFQEQLDHTPLPANPSPNLHI